jgi:prolipoprotein diacylglyceryltransferase
MYPNLYYALKDLIGVEWTGLRFINSFGFFVAMAFLAAAYILTRELKRKESAGLLKATEMQILIGARAGWSDLALNFILGFVMGYKFVGLFIGDASVTSDPQSFIFSVNGSWPAGIALGLVFTAIKWWEKEKRKLPRPEKRTIRIWPHDRVGDVVILAALFGFLGAKIFHNLENWDQFWSNPIDALLSFSGLTFYGGLICATLAIWWYARRHSVDFRHLCDAAAPALMLAYAIGRLGCQVSGDGDWGILNSAYVSTDEGLVVPSDTATYRVQVSLHQPFYMEEFGTSQADNIPHAHIEAPAWLPQWLVAYNYPHNVLSNGIPIFDCKEPQYCSQLPVPVFPTPFYETLMALLIFSVLWRIRKRITAPGVMFGIYLVLNGMERFLIEKIRVNTTYSIFGFHPTQAEIISSTLCLLGAVLWFYFQREHKRKRTV